MPLTVLNGPIIEAGEFLSDGIDCSSGAIVRMTMPADWTGANLTFQVSTDGNGYNDLYDPAGNEITMVVRQTGSGIIVPEALVKSINFLKIRSGSREHPVVQKERREFAIAVETP